MKNRKTGLILLAAGLIIGMMIYSALQTPGVKDLPGNFQEVAFSRNEQNTGPVLRVYAVTVDEGYWTEMEQYGNYMPHTKYGTTRVFFFASGKPHPVQLDPESGEIPTGFRDGCLAVYEKNGMSQVSFRRLEK